MSHFVYLSSISITSDKFRYIDSNFQIITSLLIVCESRCGEARYNNNENTIRIIVDLNFSLNNLKSVESRIEV